jgi:hypothetical protein
MLITAGWLTGKSRNGERSRGILILLGIELPGARASA